MSPSARVFERHAVRRALFPSFQRGPADPRAEAPVDATADGARTATAELAALRERVRGEALEAGQREGRAAAHAEWAGRLAALAAALERAGQELAGAREAFVVAAERELPRLTLLLVQKVIGREARTPEGAVRGVARTVAERLAGCAAPVALRLSPAAAEALREVAASRSVRVDADATLGPDDWVLETRDGFLDGRVESQLEVAWRLLEGGEA